MMFEVGKIYRFDFDKYLKDVGEKYGAIKVLDNKLFVGLGTRWQYVDDGQIYISVCAEWCEVVE